MELVLEHRSQDSLSDDAPRGATWAGPALQQGCSKTKHLTASLARIPGVHMLSWGTPPPTLGRLQRLISLGSSQANITEGMNTPAGPSSRAIVADPDAARAFSLGVRAQPLRPFLALASALGSRGFLEASNQPSPWSLAGQVA